MAKMIDELWPVFLAEVTEQLDLLELELIKVTDLKQVDVDQFFRLFHTIKSSCAMLDFKNMEEVAHTSEDLLDLARKGTLQLTEKMIDALLEAVDALKGQLKESEKTQSSPGSRQAIVALLKQQIDSAASDGSKKARTSGAQVFHVVEEEFDQLELLVQSSLDKALFMFLAGSKAEQKSHLIKLRNFFDLMGVPVIKKLFKEAVALADSETGFDSIRNADLIVSILEKIEYLEKASARDLSVARIRKIVCEQHGKYLEQQLHELGSDISTAIGNLPAFSANAFPEKLSSGIQQARNLSELSGYKSVALLLGYLYQTLKMKHYEKDACHVSKEFIEGATNFLKDINLTTLNENHIVLVNELIAKINNIDANHPILSPALASKLVNSALWKKYLKAPEIESINDLFKKGIFIFEIYADLESNTEFATRFIDWLYENTTVITNVHVDQDALRKLSINAGLAFLCYADNKDHLEKIAEKLTESSGFLQYVRIQSGDDKKNETDSAAEDASSDTTLTATLRIDSKTLDRFVSQIGEMVTRRNMLTYIINDDAVFTALKSLDELSARMASHSPAEADLIQRTVLQLSAVHTRLLHADASVQQASNRIQEEVMALRVVPIGMVFNRLPKMVRRLAKELNKSVSLQLSGESVKIDKGLVDLLMEPLSHIVRNAIDHGIESEEERARKSKTRGATLRINAVNKGNTLRIEINDDGRGLQREKILKKALARGIHISESASEEDIYSLIFLPGFSTSETVTETSGRGVGMDAVKEKIKQVGGRVSVNSQADVGTQFILELPLSVAIQGVVVVEADSQKYAIPERSVVEILEINSTDIQSVNNQSAYMLRGNILPLYDLDTLLCFERVGQQLPPLLSVIVVSNGEQQVGIAVKNVDGRHEIYVKDVHHQLLNLPGFGGASILGDGGVVIILDGYKLLKLARQNPQPASLFLKAG